MLIGLTGQIGAGKSTAAGILREFGAHVIDADQIGRLVVDRSTSLRRLLAREFGADILNKRGKLNRQRLAARAFANDRSHAALNAIVHPYLLKELRRQVKIARAKYPVVVIDAALLLDWRMDREVDLVMAITAPQTLRLQRMIDRGISMPDALARERRQLPLFEYQRRADIIIRNIASISRLETILKRFWQRYAPLPD